MVTPRALQTPITQRALSLGLAVLVTAGVLGGVAGLADGDQAAQLAQRQQLQPPATATVPAAPQA